MPTNGPSSRHVKLPDGKVLIPGVIESKTNFIEHPELVAQRIGRYAELVGRDNVIAGSDCGYGTWVGQAAVDPRCGVGQARQPGRRRAARLRANSGRDQPRQQEIETMKFGLVWQRAGPPRRPRHR